MSRWGSTKQGTDSGQQLRKSERLHQIIIGPELKSFDAIAHAVTSGQKENGSVDAFASEFFDERPSILLRQHHIDDKYIVARSARQGCSAFSIIGDVDKEPCFPEAFPEE